MKEKFTETRSQVAEFLEATSQPQTCNYAEIPPYAPEKLRALLPWPEPHANKYSRGRAVVVAGCEKYPGAACMAALSASCVGAGYVQVLCDAHSVPIVQSFMPSAVVSAWSEELSKKIKPPAAYILGPGFDAEDPACKQIITRTIKAAKHNALPILIDAGALTILSTAKGLRLLQHFTDGGGVAVLTPHAGEAARLASALGIDSESFSPEDLACALSEGLGTIVCLKGPDTCIAVPSALSISDKDEEASENVVAAPAANAVTKRESTTAPACTTPCATKSATPHKTASIYTMREGTSALAKAGTGDVLAGMIGGLLAQGMRAQDAAILGTTLHARAGIFAARMLTSISVMPKDVIAHISHAIKDVANLS